MKAPDAIRSALIGAGQPLTAPEIIDRCPDQPRNRLDVALTTMTQRGILTRTGARGAYVYTLAAPGTDAAASPPPERASRAVSRSAHKGRGAGKKTRRPKGSSSAPRGRGARQQPHDRATRDGAAVVPRVAMTADLELVLAGEHETVLYTAQETEAIARVILQHFET